MLQERPLLTAFILAQWLVGYNIVNFATWHRDRVYLIETAVDRAVPFATGWIYVYSAAYLVCLGPVFLVSGPRLRTDCFAYTLAIAISLTTFLIMPVYIARPEYDPQAWGAWLMQLTRAIDQPFNCFPSLHVSLDFLAGLMTSTERPAAGRALIVAACVVSFSTMVTKQHYFLDLVAGALVAVLAFRFAMSERVRRRLGDLDAPSP
jgi:membrane-associated phospholipid phosphatase